MEISKILFHLNFHAIHDYLLDTKFIESYHQRYLRIASNFCREFVIIREIQMSYHVC
jgi:hypothetical protein